MVKESYYLLLFGHAEVSLDLAVTDMFQVDVNML